MVEWDQPPEEDALANKVQIGLRAAKPVTLDETRGLET